MPTREDLVAAMAAAAAAAAADDAEHLAALEAEELQEASNSRRLGLKKAGELVRKTNAAIRDVAMMAGVKWSAPWEARPQQVEDPDAWTASRFVGGLQGDDGRSVIDIVASALLLHMQGDGLSIDADDAADELRYLRAIGESRRQHTDPAQFEEAIRKRIERSIGTLASLIAKGLTELVNVSIESDPGQAKFCTSPDAFINPKWDGGGGGGGDAVSGGLETKIGEPSSNVREAVEEEHTNSDDSHVTFDSPRYKISSSAAIEWSFVADEPPPKGGWPAEMTMMAPKLKRKQLSISGRGGLLFRVTELNARLASERLVPISLIEAMCGRLFTGPMHVKYHGVLRGSGLAYHACMGNRCVHCAPRLTLATALHSLRSLHSLLCPTLPPPQCTSLFLAFTRSALH